MNGASPVPEQRRPPLYPSPAGPVSYPYDRGPIQAPVSVWAVVALMCALLGVGFGWCLFGVPSVVAVVTGHVARRRTASGMESGRVLATAALVLGYVFVVPGVVGTIWALSVTAHGLGG